MNRPGECTSHGHMTSLRSHAARAAVLAIVFTGAMSHAETPRRAAVTHAPRALPALPPPPPALVAKLRLARSYTKYVDAAGVPVVASRLVHDAALREAAYLVRQMVGHRPDVLAAIAGRNIRFVVMAPTEMTTDVPEHADLTPAAYWNRRARGVGATLQRPATSCGEENLLELPGDPYGTENILVHEFAHTVHEHGMSVVDPSFDARLAAAYAHAKQAGLWAGTYAMQNRSEYWAEASQSWFDTNRANDAEHGPIDTREKLVAYDPQIATLLREAYGDRPWRYTRPSTRSAAERAHLAGFDRASAGTFVWPPSAPPLEGPAVVAAASGSPWSTVGALPSMSPPSTSPASLVISNQHGREITVDWVDFQGSRKRYASLRPGTSMVQPTYVGHVWLFSDSSGALGGVVAGPGESRVAVP